MVPDSNVAHAVQFTTGVYIHSALTSPSHLASINTALSFWDSNSSCIHVYCQPQLVYFSHSSPSHTYVSPPCSPVHMHFVHCNTHYYTRDGPTSISLPSFPFSFNLSQCHFDSPKAFSMVYTSSPHSTPALCHTMLHFCSIPQSTHLQAYIQCIYSGLERLECWFPAAISRWVIPPVKCIGHMHVWEIMLLCILCRRMNIIVCTFAVNII